MSFTVKKDNGKLYFNNYGGWETRNESTIWCIEQADKIYNWNDFTEIKIDTNDRESTANSYSYSKHNSYINLIPDFNFKNWSETGINDYNEMINKILIIISNIL